MNAELFKPLKLMTSIFKNLGMWQDDSQSWFYFFAGHFYHFVLVECYLTYSVIFSFFPRNLEHFVDIFGMAATYAAVFFKWKNFFLKIKNIKKSVETLTTLLEISIDERWKSREQTKVKVNFGFKVYKISGSPLGQTASWDLLFPSSLTSCLTCFGFLSTLKTAKLDSGPQRLSKFVTLLF